MKIQERYVLIIILSIMHFHAFAQNTELTIVGEKSATLKSFASVKLMVSYLDREINKLNADGYLGAVYDTIRTGDLKYTTTINKGDQFKWGNVELKGNAHVIGPKQGKILNKLSFKSTAEKNLNSLENKGYPFASVKFDSITITEGKINGNLHIEKGKYYKIDSLIVKGDVKVPKIYLQRYIGIKPGMAYNESMIREINKRLKEIAFITPIKSSEVLFTQNQSMVYVYLKKRNASSFNGIVGILPDSRTGKTTITGDARVNLKNAFGKAETLDLNWRKIANKTQDLKINVILPFLFSSPIGTDLFFKLFKRDTSFLELNRTLGLTWQMSRGNFFRMFYNRYNSDILAKTIYTSTTQAGLQNADVGINQYGIGFRFEKLDYRINPRKGIALSTDGTAGTKELKPNAANDATLYSSEQLKTEYYTGNLLFESYIPVGKSFTFKFANQSRFILNQKIYKNELMRLGGIKNIRGFDEESILTSAFTVFTGEFRFIFEENSTLFAFFDQAWHENSAVGAYVNDMPYGFGAGVNFQVKTGVFTFTWALGKQMNNPILVKNSKLHFGFINYF
jgi:outer membrane protein assembly factor BamA